MVSHRSDFRSIRGELAEINYILLQNASSRRRSSFWKVRTGNGPRIELACSKRVWLGSPSATLFEQRGACKQRKNGISDDQARTCDFLRSVNQFSFETFSRGRETNPPRKHLRMC
jgi:hypothetical protein